MLTTNGYGPELPDPTLAAEPEAPLLRVAVALGDAERELALLVALGEAGDVVVAERCLSAEQLLARARGAGVDALLVARDLHRLNEETLEELGRTGLPLVLLAPPGAVPCRHAAAVLPPDADAASVREALLAAARGDTSWRTARVEAEQPEIPTAAAVEGEQGLAVLSIASGNGAPGRTTVAVNLAAALGAIAPTVLVDADMSGPSVAAHLDLDPTRNLYMVAHAEPDTDGDWDRALAREVQPLHPQSPHGVALCGVPKSEMRPAVTRAFLEHLVAHLRGRYRYVVLDVGADLLGAESAPHRAALALADRVLLVAATDVVGLWHARQGLGALRQLGVPPERTALVLNRHDGRFHHGREEIEWALGARATALVPFDHTGSERALAEHRPMALDHRSRAGYYLLFFAGHVHGGRIEPPPIPKPPRQRRRFRLPWPRRRRNPAAPTGASNGDRARA